MVVACVVTGCFNRHTPEFAGSFHRFPKSPLLYMRWVESLHGRLNGNVWLATRRHQVCSEHFLPDDFTESFMENGVAHIVLRSTAVPAVFPRASRPSNGEKRQVDANENKGDNDESEDPSLSLRTKAAVKRVEKGLNIQLQKPYKDRDVMRLVSEYLFLLDTVQQLKQLARINVDLLYLSLDLHGDDETRTEVDKVQELIHALMNGREVYGGNEMSNLEMDEDTREAGGSDKQQEMANGRSGTYKEHKSEYDTRQDLNLDDHGTERATTIDDDDDSVLVRDTELACYVNDREKEQKGLAGKSVPPRVEMEDETNWDEDDENDNALDEQIENLGLGNVTAIGKDMVFVIDFSSSSAKGVDLVDRPHPVSVSLSKPVSVDRPNPVSVGHSKPVSVGHPDPVSVGQSKPVTVGRPDPVSVDCPDPVSSGYFNPVAVFRSKLGRPRKEKIISDYIIEDDHSYSCPDESSAAKPEMEGLTVGQRRRNGRGVNDKSVKFGDGGTFKNRLELDEFLDTFCDDKDYDKQGGRHILRCKFCYKPRKSKRSLRSHLTKFHLESTLFLCRQCGKEFKQRDSLKRHLQSSSEKCKKVEYYKCVACEKEFLSYWLLDEHKKVSPSCDHKSRLCFICGVTLKDKSALVKHLELHERLEKNGPRKCKICSEDLALTARLDVHRECRPLDSFVCEVCGKAFQERKYLVKHVRGIHERGTEACPVCSKNILKMNFKRHLRTHTGYKPFECSICHWKFSQKTSLQAHLIRHSGKFPHSCSICAKGFVSKHLLVTHEKMHNNGQKLFSCLDCGRSFWTEATVNAHTANGRCPSGFVQQCTYECPLCHSQYKKRISYALHLLSSHGRQLDHCPICVDDGQKFSSSDFQSHMKTVHLSEKPFQCRDCGEAFHIYNQLCRHRILHKDKNALTCKDCGRSCATLATLQSHRRNKHTMEHEYYPCEICGKEFRSKSNLRQHSIVHSDSKSKYKCSTCGLVCSSSSSLQAHLWTHAKVKKHQCAQCDKGFNDKRSYKSHMKSEHPEVETMDLPPATYRYGGTLTL